ncbi:VanW family protein [Luteimonas gilva]|uniref:VanW family protein n=1 Tax=Luteimonas gilva TaxID=2572684 RepID=UPI001CB8AA41|nr:VanW family protein [Luteimonas gilva]
MRALRLIEDIAAPAGRRPASLAYRPAAGDDEGRVLAESVSPLWTSLFDDRSALVAGKVQNLRVAATKLDGLHFAAGDVFSFWKAVGRPTERRGYVEGRELREGCMISSIGGGLCQLSNALYSAALDAGMRIVERHPHSQVVPGSLAERGRDATVFWNYLDLRFRCERAFAIEARLTQDRLIVRFRGDAAPRREASSRPALRAALVGDPAPAPDDCGDCAQGECVQRFEPAPRSRSTGYLLDEMWPEFDRWIAGRLRSGDFASVPMDGVRRKRPNYAWNSVRNEGVRLVEHRWLALRRSLASRRLQAQGAARQRRLLAFDREFARAFAKAVPYDAEQLVVPVGMLAELVRTGVLGGRRYAVLMTRAPIAMLQRDLDRAAALHPESPTLADFRADEALVRLEETGLGNADSIVTPHTAVADYAGRYGVPVERLEWVFPEFAGKASQGKSLLFPASALGRKGAYEVREACAELGLEVRVLGSASEGEGFWRGTKARAAAPGDIFADVGCVVLPAYVEHRPGLLLKALAAGIPVICSPECGLPAQLPATTVVPAGDARRLVEALKAMDLA